MSGSVSEAVAHAADRLRLRRLHRAADEANGAAIGDAGPLKIG